MIPERSGFPTRVDNLECTGETAELFQGELLGEDVIKSFFHDHLCEATRARQVRCWAAGTQSCERNPVSAP